MQRRYLVLLLSLPAILPITVGAGESLPPGALRRLPEVAAPPLLAATERRQTIRDIRLSADGKVVTARKADGTVQAWDLAAGKLLRRWRLDEKTMAAALSPDG